MLTLAKEDTRALQRPRSQRPFSLFSLPPVDLCQESRSESELFTEVAFFNLLLYTLKTIIPYKLSNPILYEYTCTYLLVRVDLII